ncbi:hypothetical protein [Albirhodobacter sp. R86504]|jgi:hypothetical protein|uniref:hypothetical protein n=1 Tax=Albirhodobacter sp. R86504 TaxID=3093848 RepID=UPI003672D83C
MFRHLRPLSFVLCVLAIGACTVDENGNIVPSPSSSAGSTAKPKISQAGTCFMFVTEETGGTYKLTTGVGDGTNAPLGEEKKGLTAEKLDALYASELAIMNISPECLAILATDRTEARPAKRASS